MSHHTRARAAVILGALATLVLLALASPIPAFVGAVIIAADWCLWLEHHPDGR